MTRWRGSIRVIVTKHHWTLPDPLDLVLPYPPCCVHPATLILSRPPCFTSMPWPLAYLVAATASAATEQQNVTMLNRMVQQIGTTRDTAELRGQCRCQLEVVKELSGKIQSGVRSLGMAWIAARVARNVFVVLSASLLQLCCKRRPRSTVPSSPCPSLPLSGPCRMSKPALPLCLVLFESRRSEHGEFLVGYFRLFQAFSSPTCSRTVSLLEYRSVHDSGEQRATEITPHAVSNRARALLVE